MPIEIRELSIKTQIVSPEQARQPLLSTKDVQQLKKQLLQELLPMLKPDARKNSFDR